MYRRHFSATSALNDSAVMWDAHFKRRDYLPLVCMGIIYTLLTTSLHIFCLERQPAQTGGRIRNSEASQQLTWAWVELRYLGIVHTVDAIVRTWATPSRYITALAPSFQNKSRSTKKAILEASVACSITLWKCSSSIFYDIQWSQTCMMPLSCKPRVASPQKV